MSSFLTQANRVIREIKNTHGMTYEEFLYRYKWILSCEKMLSDARGTKLLRQACDKLLAVYYLYEHMYLTGTDEDTNE